MKTIQSICIFLFWTSLISCQSASKKKGVFKLIPLPQHFEIKGNSSIKPADIKYYHGSWQTDLPEIGTLISNLQPADKKSKADIVFQIDSTIDIKTEGYRLDISKNQVNITAKDRAGLLYACMTLKQLMEDADNQDVFLPVCTISDYPALAYRAVHLDVKHHLEKTGYYYQLMDKLAGYKINAIILEIEDKLKYERQPEIGSGDALSIDEWKKLSNYAQQRNIEISPLVQGLGHASYILKHDTYKNLRDDPASDWAFNPLDPETCEVQYDLYLDAMEATPHGKYLHVGGDEVHTTGRGSGRSPLELQLIWLNKVCRFAEEHGRIPVFWDDMPLKHAGVYRAMFNKKLTQEEVDSIWSENEHKLLEFIDLFPKNCIYMRWNYSASQALGNIKAMEWFINNDLKVMGATAGQTRWVLMPQNESNIDNIKSFALSSINSGLNGLLLTLWDDDSPHFELYMRGIIAFSEYSWSGDKRTKEEFKSAYRQREFSFEASDPEYAFIDQLEEPVAFWKNALLKGNKRNYLHKIDNPVDEVVIDLPGKKSKGEWSEKNRERLAKADAYYKQCESIAETIKEVKSISQSNIYTLEVYEQVNKLAQFGTKALLALKAYDIAPSSQQKSDALKKIQQLQGEFNDLREQFEEVYGKTRILSKPEDYILDQDYHVHLANQAISFDWQFYAEILFLEKINSFYGAD